MTSRFLSPSSLGCGKIGHISSFRRNIGVSESIGQAEKGDRNTGNFMEVNVTNNQHRNDASQHLMNKKDRRQQETFESNQQRNEDGRHVRNILQDRTNRTENSQSKHDRTEFFTISSDHHARGEAHQYRPGPLNACMNSRSVAVNQTTRLDNMAPEANLEITGKDLSVTRNKPWQLDKEALKNQKFDRIASEIMA